MLLDLVSKYLHQTNSSIENVLDLGCGSSYQDEFEMGHRLFDFYTNFNSNLLIGVDNEALVFCTEYQDFIHRFPNRLTQEKFNEHFIFIVSSIDQYLAENIYKFNLVVLSNVLHFYSDVFIKNTLKRISSILSDQGIIFIKVASHKHHTTKNDNITGIKHFSAKQILDIIFLINFKVEFLIEKDGHFHILLSVKSI